MNFFPFDIFILTRLLIFADDERVLQESISCDSIYFIYFRFDFSFVFLFEFFTRYAWPLTFWMMVLGSLTCSPPLYIFWIFRLNISTCISAYVWTLYFLTVDTLILELVPCLLYILWCMYLSSLVTQLLLFLSEILAYLFIPVPNLNPLKQLEFFFWLCLSLFSVWICNVCPCAFLVDFPVLLWWEALVMVWNSLLYKRWIVDAFLLQCDVSVYFCCMCFVCAVHFLLVWSSPCCTLFIAMFLPFCTTCVFWF